MRLGKRRSVDLPLGNDPSSRFLLWIAALMCWLAVAAPLGASVVADLAARWGEGAADALSVRVPATGDGEGVTERAESALAASRSFPGVRSARRLDAGEMSRLLEPWLGPGAAADPELPIPALIDVRTDGPIDTAALAEKLRAAAPGSILDDHGVWLAELRSVARLIEVAAGLVVSLVVAVGLVAVAFAVRAGLAIHGDVVRLLHLLGADDAYVSRRFESHVARLTLIGSGVGSFVAVGCVWGVGTALTGVLAPAGLAFSVPWWGVIAPILAPLVLVGLSALTARRAVRRALEEMP